MLISRSGNSPSQKSGEWIGQVEIAEPPPAGIDINPSSAILIPLPDDDQAARLNARNSTIAS